MQNNEALEKAVSSFIENPYWKEYLESAPSEQCKEYIMLEFYYSDLAFEENDYKEEASQAMEQLKSGFSVRDWEHLMKYAGNTPFKAECKEKIEKLNQKS